jgi:hypothetical protein
MVNLIQCSQQSVLLASGKVLSPVKSYEGAAIFKPRLGFCSQPSLAALAHRLRPDHLCCQARQEVYQIMWQMGKTLTALGFECQEDGDDAAYDVKRPENPQYLEP